MSTDFREDLNRRIKDPEFAKEFGAEVAKTAFAVTLTKTRKGKGFTQADLARELGVKQSYVAKLETGNTNPTLGMVGKTLAVLGMRLETDAAPLASKESPKSEQRLAGSLYFGIYGRRRISRVARNWADLQTSHGFRALTAEL